MTAEDIKKELELNCKSIKTKKIFALEEIQAIHLMIDDNKFSITKASSFFHTDAKKLSKIINLLKQKNPKKEGDYEKLLQEING